MQPAEMRPQAQKVRQNKTTEKHVAEEGTGKYPQDEINEEQIGNLPKKDFRVMIVKRSQDLKNRVQAWIEKVK